MVFMGRRLFWVIVFMGISFFTLLLKPSLACSPGLEPSLLYTKTGGTYDHPGPCLPQFASPWEECDPNTDYTEGYPNIDINHYGNPLFMDKIVAITQEFKAVFPSETVLLNDMSLPLGGVFDINGDWEPPHLDHQEGEAVDYNLLYFPLGFNSTSVEAERLARFIKKKHLNIHVEGDHWHIQMKPGQF